MSNSIFVSQWTQNAYSLAHTKPKQTSEELSMSSQKTSCTVQLVTLNYLVAGLKDELSFVIAWSD